MLLLDRGISVDLKELEQRAGGAPSNPSGLERALNACDPTRGWVGGLVRLANAPPEATARALSRLGPWLAILWARGARLGHAVVIDGFDGRGAQVRDPWSRGWRYHLTTAAFVEHWTGIAVHRREP